MDTENIAVTDSDSLGERITKYRASALKLVIELDETVNSLTGATFLFAQVLPFNEEVPGTALAESFITAPTGKGPFEIDFNGAQLNQDLDELPRKSFKLAIYATYSSETPDILYICEFVLVESGVPLMVPLPPAVETLLLKSYADSTYATIVTTDGLDSRIDDLEENSASAGDLDTLSDALTAEITARTNADNGLTAAVSSLSTTVGTKAATTYVDSGIAEERSERESADAEETSARISDVSAVSGRITVNDTAISGLTSRLETAEIEIDSLQSGQANGHKGYASLTALNADLVPADGALGEVTNDVTPANNGVYRKVGATGTGSWVKSDEGIYAEIDALQAVTAPLSVSLTTLAFSDGRSLVFSLCDAQGRVAAGLLSTGEWVSVHSHATATTSSAGFMSTDQAALLQTLSIASDIYSSSGHWQYALIDSEKRVVFGVTDDGTVRAHRAVFDSLPGTLSVDGLVVGAIPMTVRTDLPGWSLIISDDQGRVGLGIREDGSTILPGLAITATMLAAESVTNAKLDLTLRRENANDYVATPADGIRTQLATVGAWYNNRWLQLPNIPTPVLWGINDSTNTVDIRPTTGLNVRGRRRINSYNPGTVGSVTYKGDLTSSSTWPPTGSFVTGDYYAYISTGNRTIGSDTVRLGDLMVYNGSAWIYQGAPGTGVTRLEQDWWDISANGTFNGVSYVVGDRILYVGFQSEAGVGYERWHKSNTAAGEFYRNTSFVPTSGLPSSPVDGELYDASAAGTTGGFTFAIGDYAMRWAGTWGKITSGTIQTFAAGALIHLPCKANANEWEVRRGDGGTTLNSLTLNAVGRPIIRRSNNGILVIGDSMAGQPGPALAALIPERTVTTRSYGGGTASNILSTYAYVIADLGDPDVGKTLVTFIGQNSNGFRGQNFMARQRIMELSGAADRRVLHVSMLGQRVLTWNGTRLVCANFEEQRVAGSTNSYARDVESLRATWPDQWMWAAQSLCDAAATDTEPSIQWPGMTNAQVAATYGIPPLKWCRSISLTGVVLGSLNYLGAHSSAGLPTGGNDQDYYLRTGNGTIGNPIIKISGTWTEITFDPIHLNTTGDGIQAAKIKSILDAKNW